MEAKPTPLSIDIYDEEKGHQHNNCMDESATVLHKAAPTVFTSMKATLVPYQETEEETESKEKAIAKVINAPKLLQLSGIHEVYLLSLYKAVLIEFIGTALFTFIHVAIVLACVNYTYPPLQIGIAHGFLLALFILQFAMSSGAHFNSLITISTMVTGHTPIVRGILYTGVQMLGAATGAEIMRGSIAEETARSVGLGGCNTGSLETNEALAIEFFFSLALICTAYGTAFNLRQREIYGPVLPPFLIGISLALIIFSSSSLSPPPYTGAGANPSMCFGTAWAYASIVGRDTAFSNHWVYWIGTIITAIVHAAIYTIAPPHHAEKVKSI